MNKPARGLGKGLSALIPSAPKFGENNTDTTPNISSSKNSPFLYLRLDQLKPNPYQPRKRFDEDALHSLSSSLRTHGMLQPLVVTPDPQDKSYIIVAGERRWRAAQIARMSTVPALVKTLPSIELLKLALVENLLRAELSPIETAIAFKQLKVEQKLTQDEISQIAGLSRSAVANKIRLLDLEPSVLDLVDAGKLSEGVVRPLIGLEKNKQKELAQRIITEGLTARQIETIVQNLHKPKNKQKIATHEEQQLNIMSDKLSSRLGTRSKITGSAKGGKIILYYNNYDSLTRLLNSMGIDSEIV